MAQKTCQASKSLCWLIMSSPWYCFPSNSGPGDRFWRSTCIWFASVTRNPSQMVESIAYVASSILRYACIWGHLINPAMATSTTSVILYEQLPRLEPTAFQEKGHLSRKIIISTNSWDQEVHAGKYMSLQYLVSFQKGPLVFTNWPNKPSSFT